jgi:polysaccharide chain length determinant protein (PEP-CTERM system associated)
MADRFSVPRRSLDIEDYLDMLRRNFLWIVAPVFAGLVVATIVAFLMEDTYVSNALIRIVPQQIADNLVQNATSQIIADHINAMAESILSRNTLTNLIQTNHLYARELKSEPLEDVINKMKLAISIRPTMGVADLANSQRSLPAMRVSFKYRDRLLAQKICDDIVSRFMTQNTQEGQERTESATQFMADETDRAKRELDEVDQRLAGYRTRNAGKLPEQMELNIQQMNALSQQENALNDGLNRNTEKRLLLENNLQIAKDRLAAIKDVTPQAQERNERVEELNREISRLQTDIETMKDHYTEDFPDLKNARQQLAVLQRQRDAALKEKPKDTGVDNPAVVRERLDAQATVDSLKGQVEANALEDRQLQKQLQNVRAQVAAYQSRIASVPGGQQEYVQLMNDRERAKQQYDDLVAKRQKTNLSADLQRRKQGETLEVLDAASLPDTPTEPKRPLIISLGPAIGLVIGLAIVGIREVKDTSLKSLKDARLYTHLNILASIPLLENDLVVQRRKQIIWLGWATATIAGLALMGVTIAHYYFTKT